MSECVTVYPPTLVNLGYVICVLKATLQNQNKEKRRDRFCNLDPYVFLLFFQAKKRGLVMINFFSYFLTCSNSSTINDVVGKFLKWVLSTRDNHNWDKLICFHLNSSKGFSF